MPKRQSHEHVIGVSSGVRSSKTRGKARSPNDMNGGGREGAIRVNRGIEACLGPIGMLLATCLVGMILLACRASNGALPVRPEPLCSRGFDATFVQLNDGQLHYGQSEWAKILDRFRDLGVRTVVLQYTGDEYGGYERRKSGASPVRDLLDVANAKGIDVFLGLYADPSWPSRFDLDAPPPPLNDEPAAQTFGELCRDHSACTGFYIPQEIDDSTWALEPKRSLLRSWLERTSAQLRELAPGRLIAIAPFYTRALSPEDHASFHADLLRNRPVDIVMLQDGIGSGHGSVESLGPRLSAMRTSLESRSIRLYSVVELFDQESGPPRDELPFSARPAAFGRVYQALRAQMPHVDRIVAFSVLDYMAPEKSQEASALHREYLRYCR